MLPFFCFLFFLLFPHSSTLLCMEEKDEKEGGGEGKGGGGGVLNGVTTGRGTQTPRRKKPDGRRRRLGNFDDRKKGSGKGFFSYFLPLVWRERERKGRQNDLSTPPPPPPPPPLQVGRRRDGNWIILLGGGKGLPSTSSLFPRRKGEGRGGKMSFFSLFICQKKAEATSSERKKKNCGIPHVSLILEPNLG